MADRRDAADGEPGQLVGLAGRGAPDVRLADDGGEPGQVDPVRARDEGDDRLGAVVAVGHEDERLHDLAELRADRRRRLCGRVGRLVEDAAPRGHALAGGGIEDAPNGRVVEGVGHGAESSIGWRDARPDVSPPGRSRVASRPCRRSSSPTATSPARGGSTRHGPAGTAPSALVIAADGGARHARALGLARRPLGRRWRLDRPGRARASRGGRGADIGACAAAKDESDTELAVLAALGAAPTGSSSSERSAAPCSITPWPTSGLLARSGLAGIAGASCCRIPRARIALLRAPTPDGRPVDRTLLGRVGGLVSLLPLGDGVAGVTTARARLPAWRRAAAGRPGARALERAARRPMPAVDRPARDAARRSKSPATLPAMSIRPSGDPRARDRPSRRDRHHPSPRRPARALDDPLLLPEGRHARLHHRGVRVPRHERDDPRARRRRLGHQPAGRRRARGVPREVRPAVHAPRRRGARGAEAYGVVGREAELRQDVLGHGADDVPRRPGRAASPGPGRRSSPRAMPPRSSPRSTTCRRRGSGDGRLQAPDTKETSLVGGDERSLGREGYCRVPGGAIRIPGHRDVLSAMRPRAAVARTSAA